MSKQSNINEIYSMIAGIVDPESGIARPGTGFAESGDLFFSITHYPYANFRDVVDGMDWKSSIWVRRKTLLGFDRDDYDAWHVAIYTGGRKRKYHKRINLWITHSTSDKGIHAQQIIPKFFTNGGPGSRSRVEILQFKGISGEQRKIIGDFANAKLGLSFDRAKWRHTFLTYALGLPNIGHFINQYSCQQLAIAAYEAAGIHFPHPYKSFPIFNIGRYLGHPLGHPKDRVDPRYPYLMDHHIYRDPRFVLKAAVYQDPNTDEIILQTENLKKYSWNETLREKYIKKGYLDP
jgi:hypothetical protein